MAASKQYSNIQTFDTETFFTLAGSWVKLDGSFRNGNGAQHSPVISEDGAMEDLLAEAVEDHKNSSRQDWGINWAVVRGVRELIAFSRKFIKNLLVLNWLI